MPKLCTPLTEKQIAELAPKDAKYQLGDGRGLCLVIEPTGVKRWRMGYKFLGTETCMSFGAYPEVSLSEARQRRDDVHRLIAADINQSNSGGNKPSKTGPSQRRNRNSDFSWNLTAA